jgi:hypothetical protein
MREGIMVDTKRLEGLMRQQIDPDESALKLRRGQETISVSVDAGGEFESITYSVIKPDGSEISIQGEDAVVRNGDDVRFYKLTANIGGVSASHSERISDKNISAGVDSALMQEDLSMINGAMRTFEEVLRAPEGFKKTELFE